MNNILFCPKCGSVSFKKDGFISKTHYQRYKCKDCGTTFCNTTNIVMYKKKLNREIFRKLVSLIIDDTKIQTICDVLHISSRTAYIWRMKIYECAHQLTKSTLLSGKVWIDETYVPVNRKELIPSPTGKKYRGLSRNQIIVACTIDKHKNKYAKVIGRGHITSSECINSYGKHIKKGSHIIHDGIFSHDALIKYLDATDEIYKSIGLENHKKLQPVNTLCSMIKRNLIIHIGMNRDYLQKYLDWICFKSTITKKNIEKKIDQLEAICFLTKAKFRVKDRYYR